MKKFFIFLPIILFLGVGGVIGLWWFFGPVERKSIPIVFTVYDQANIPDQALKLKDQNLIRQLSGFNFLSTHYFKNKVVLAGGYRLNQNMNAWQILQKITSQPDLVWVVIPEGKRKEQIGELLTTTLGWDKVKQKDWNEIYNQTKPDFAEGVFFPDTYLLPRDESVQQIAQRFINHFNEKFATYIDKFTKKNIRWTTGLKIASLIQREAGGSWDMPLISGIIWNRLNQGMKLEIDATLQYLAGNADQGWWRKVAIADKMSPSLYNTYKYKGLPPHPICNPGLTAIEAALDPVETDCLFYLHDSNRQIHCAKTYKQHLANIRKYLL